MTSVQRSTQPLRADRPVARRSSGAGSGAGYATDEPSAPAPGLQRAGARVPIDEYTHRLWDRRWFVVAYSTATNGVGYEQSFLGQAWQLLTPLLNIGVYYLIFAQLLHTNRGVPNFIAYLTIGVFFFHFMQNSLTAGARSIISNIGLVRALPFPRAVLPISTTVVGLLQLLYSLVVMVPILLITGEPVTWRWLEIVPTLALVFLFSLGLAFATARIGALVPDTAQVLPFVARVWMYTSGVMFSVPVFTRGRPPIVAKILTNNPGNMYLTLARHALLVGNPAPFSLWLKATAWAIGMFAVCYLYFWRGEEKYGNV